MALLVQKYGGSSVATLERIQHVASRIMKAKEQGHDVVVVVSAMQGETDRLINLAQSLSPEPNPREYDALVSTGELVSIALLSIALNNAHCPARSYSGLQAKILTDDEHMHARILDVQTTAIHKDLENGFVVIVAGFQGVNSQGDVTTLGRGGSDTTAVALAAALKATECQIYTDVEGVFTTDPRLVPEAQLLPQISFEEMLELSNCGAKVLQMRAVEFAKRHHTPIRVLSTFKEGPGTLVTANDPSSPRHLISGLACTREDAHFSLGGIPNKPNLENYIIESLNKAHVDACLLTQNKIEKNSTDINFTVHRKDYSKALHLIQQLGPELKAESIKEHATVAKLTLVGLGVQSHNWILSKMLGALHKATITILMTVVSDIKISVIVEDEKLEESLRAIHQAFDLNTINSEQQQIYMEV